MSEVSVESTEDSFNKSESLVPDPPALRRRLTLGSLLVVGLAAFFVVSLLSPNARYALTRGGPQELGRLDTADLNNGDHWVSASGTPEPSALSFSRLGARGSFRLTQVHGRENVWLLLRVPARRASDDGADFVPPSHFVGRLSPISELHFLPSEIADVVRGSAISDEAFVLVDGESPRSQRPSLIAAVLLALLGIACLSFAVQLWRDVTDPHSPS